jgi:hypothetical protein
MQKILSCVTLIKRAHKPDQTGAPRHKSPRIIARAHMFASKRKVEPGRLHLRSTKPIWTLIQVHFDVEYPLHVLKAVAKVCIHKDGGNRLGGYKRRPPHIHTHHLGEEEEKGGLHLLELLSRVG